ncbi:MAG: hypothetical protein LBN24_13520, partial [Mediterranea sp.]|nr:hypothetical protein [Mediterranea sp.]
MAKVVAARQWIEQNYNGYIQTRTPIDTTSAPSTLIFDWENARTFQKGRYETVEIPIIQGWDLLILDESTADRLLAGGTVDSLYNFTRLVVETDRKTDSICSFIMTFIGSYEYLTSKRSLRENSYLERDPSFDGTVMFHYMTGDFMNGWKYEKGEIVSALISQKQDGGAAIVRTRRTESGYDNCYVYTEATASATSSTQIDIVVTATQVCFHSNNGGGGYSGTNYNTGSHDRPKGAATPAGSTGMGPGYNNSSPTSVAPKASKIFRNSKMTLENWKVVEKMLNKIIENCMGNALYQAIVKDLDGKTVTIEFANLPKGTNGQFGPDPATGAVGIKINTNTKESNVLFHEMWHAHQSYQETLSTFNASVINQEIEAYY